MIAGYDRWLTAAVPAADADRDRGDAGADRIALHQRAERLLPIQDAGLIQGISEARLVSLGAMAERRALADEILKDPDVVSLSSFIGIDGSNATLNSGRFLIELKPHADRADGALASSNACANACRGAGHRAVLPAGAGTRHRRPQRRTQYQFTLTSPELADLSTWTPRLLEKLQAQPALADVASDLQDQGVQAWYRDRPQCRGTAGRHRRGDFRCAVRRVWPAPDLDHLHAGRTQHRWCWKRARISSSAPKRSSASAWPRRMASRCRCSGIARIEERPASLLVNHIGQFPAVTLSLNLAPGHSLGEEVLRQR